MDIWSDTALALVKCFENWLNDNHIQSLSNGLFIFKSRLAFRGEVFSVELLVENEVKDIDPHLNRHNNYFSG